MIKGQVSVWIVGSPNTPMQMQNAQKSQSVASSCKLKLARFSTLLRFQDRAQCGKGTELHGEDTAHTLSMEGTIGVGTSHSCPIIIFHKMTDLKWPILVH